MPDGELSRSAMPAITLKRTAASLTEVWLFASVRATACTARRLLSGSTPPRDPEEKYPGRSDRRKSGMDASAL